MTRITIPNGEQPKRERVPHEAIVRALECSRPNCSCHRTAEVGRGRTHCPAHDDQTPSLSVGRGKTADSIFKCHTGCTSEEVIAALVQRELWHECRDSSGRHWGSHERKGAWYPGPDAEGDVHPAEEELFGSDTLNGSDTVLVVEGERCQLAAARGGIPALGTFGANMTPTPRSLGPLRGRVAVLCPDNDDPGRKHMRRVAASLAGLAREVRWLELPELPEKGDVADFLANGSSEELRTRIESAAPYASRRRLELVNLAEVEAEEVPWLAYGRISRGALAVITGHPDAGKTWLTLQMAARLSRGEPLFPGDEAPAPQKSLFLIAEDALKFQVRPRFDSLGGDARMLNVVRAVHLEDGTEEWPDLQRDLDLIEEELRKGYGLLVLELNSYLASADAAKSDVAMRRILLPLARIAEDLGVAVISIIHPNKGGVGIPLYRILNSVANVAVVRTVLAVGRDKSDGEDSPRRHVVALKNNLMPDEEKPEAISFTLTKDEGFKWSGASTATGDSLLSTDSTSEEERSEQDEAREFLSDLLREKGSNGEMVEAKEAIRRWEQEGHNRRSLQRVRKGLGWKVIRQGQGKEHRVYWAAPTGDTTGDVACDTHNGVTSGADVTSDHDHGDPTGDKGATGDTQMVCQESVVTGDTSGARRCLNCGTSLSLLAKGRLWCMTCRAWVEPGHEEVAL